MKSVSGAKKSSAPDALLSALKKSEVRNAYFLTSDFFMTFFGGGEDASIWLRCRICTTYRKRILKLRENTEIVRGMNDLFMATG